jgi:hypothetical protein
LAFHPYPQVIRTVFNPYRFGPPLGVTRASPCSWVDRPGFGSTPRHSRALVAGLAFALAPRLKRLASRLRRNSPDHNAKGTQSGAQRPPPTACRQVVSGSLSLPAQGCFSPVPHGTRPLSVTQESLALEGGPPSFTPDSTSPALLRNSTTTSPSASATGLSPSRAPRSKGLRLPSLVASVGPTTPGRLRAPVWARPSSLAATMGISFDFSSSRYLDVSVPSVCLRPKADDEPHDSPGCPIRPSRDHRVCATPPSLSQLTTAFIASVCPGIPHLPSVT